MIPDSSSLETFYNIHWNCGCHERAHDLIDVLHLNIEVLHSIRSHDMGLCNAK
jgi:hypothetical protein